MLGRRHRYKTRATTDNRDLTLEWLASAITRLGGGGGFSLTCKDFGENIRQCIPRLRFFFKVEISSSKLIPLLKPGSVHSGSAS